MKPLAPVTRTLLPGAGEKAACRGEAVSGMINLKLHKVEQLPDTSTEAALLQDRLLEVGGSSQLVSVVMLIVADTHVHLYACFDLRQSFAAAAVNLQSLVSESVKKLAVPGDVPVAKFLFLTESCDCHFFRDFALDRIRIPGLRFEVTDEPQVLKVYGQQDFLFYLVAGRQIVTRENLEILALGTDQDLSSGLSAKATIELVANAGAMPVLNWAPGKWWFGRGKIVAGLIREENQRPAFAICDNSLRPAWTPRPRLMREAAAAGINILAGTDPLPMAGE